VTVLKGGEIDRFLASPDPKRPVILIYGPDSGLVAERAKALARIVVADLNDPFSVVRIDGDVLASDPVRLADEANTMAMFGTRRLVWVRAGEKPMAAAVSPLLASPPSDATVLIEAGDLKKSAPLRTEAEKSANAAVIACYSDNEADLKRLIAEETRAAGLAIDPAAATLLGALLGGDRAASRAEIRKICLYAHGTGTISVADIEAVAGESLSLGIDEIIDAAASGDAASLDRLLLRASTSGIAVPQIMTAMSRHLSALHKARVAIENGASVSMAAERFEPPLFFRRKAVVERQLAQWSAERLQRMITRAAEATFETRIKAPLAEAIVSRTLMAIAMTARQGRRG
jgi:DNA polymerase-3 subunit delta